MSFLISKKDIESQDPLTYNMIQLLYGILLKMNPKTKGEGLEIIDRVQHIKENLQIEERLMFIYYDDFHLGSDIDPAYLSHLFDTVNKIDGSGVKLL
jgi:hypothetical protein